MTMKSKRTAVVNLLCWNEAGILVSRPVTVLSARREPWIKRVFDIDPKRPQLERRIEEMVNEYNTYWSNARSINQVQLDHTGNEWNARTSWERNFKSRDEEIMEAMLRVQHYETSTLDMLVRVFDADDNFKEILPFLNAYRKESQCGIREGLSYAGLMTGLSVDQRANAFHNLRSIHPIFALQDLSELTGTQRKTAETVLAVIVKLVRHRGFDTHRTDGVFTQHLNNGAAETLMEQPDRADDIFDYVMMQGDVAIDAGMLREWLASSSRALAGGAL